MMESWKQRDANIACAGKNKKTKKKTTKQNKKKDLNVKITGIYQLS